MSYLELLKDPRWQKKRLEILQRDNWTCCVCGNCKKTLHVHHKVYWKGHKPWQYSNDKLITLCEDCHSNEELALKQLKEGGINFLIESIFSASELLYLVNAISDAKNLTTYDNQVFLTLINKVLSSAEIQKYITEEIIFKDCNGPYV